MKGRFLDIRSTFDELQPDDPAYERYVQRLKEDLGLNDEAVEVILGLRNQVTALQAHLHRLEADIQIYESSKNSRMTRYRQVYFEAEWEETEE
jgi:hypothetical protein